MVVRAVSGAPHHIAGRAHDDRSAPLPAFLAHQPVKVRPGDQVVQQRGHENRMRTI